MWASGYDNDDLSLGVRPGLLKPKFPLCSALAHLMPATEIAAFVCHGVHVIGSILQSSRIKAAI